MKLPSNLLRHAAVLAILTACTISAKAQIYSVSGDTLSEIDPTTGNVIASVSTTDGSNMQTVTVSGGVIYVGGVTADENSLEISTYSTALTLLNPDLATLTRTFSQDGGTGSGAAAISVVNGTIYVNNDTYNDGSIDTIDATTGAVTQPLITKHPEHDDFTGMAVSDSVVYGALFQAGVVQTFDPTTGAVINSDFITVPNDDSPGLIALSADGSTLYVVDHSNGYNPNYYDTILAYNATTGAEEGSVRLQGYGQAGVQGTVGGLYIDGDNLYVTDGNTGVLSDYDSSNGVWLDDIGNNAGGQFSVINSLPPVDPVGGTPGNGQGVPPDAGGPGAAPEPRSWALAGLVLAVFAGMFKLNGVAFGRTLREV